MSDYCQVRGWSEKISASTIDGNMEKKVGYCYPSGLEETLRKWEMYVPLVTKGLTSYRYFGWAFSPEEPTWPLRRSRNVGKYYTSRQIRLKSSWTPLTKEYNSTWVRALSVPMHLGPKTCPLCPILWYQQWFQTASRSPEVERGVAV